MYDKNFLVLGSYLYALSLFSQQSTWQAPESSPFWDVPANWSGSIPGDTGTETTTAIFPFSGANLTVELGNGTIAFDPVLQNIQLHGSYTISPPALFPASITAYTIPTTQLSILVDSFAAPNIIADINIGSGGTLALSIGDLSSLTLSGEVNLTNGILTQTGGGSLVLSGTVLNIGSSGSPQTMNFTAPSMTLIGTGGAITPIPAGLITCQNTGAGDAVLNLNSGTSLTIEKEAHVSVIADTGDALFTSTDATINLLSGTITAENTFFGPQGNSTMTLSNSQVDIADGRLTVSANLQGLLSVDQTEINLVETEISCSSQHDASDIDINDSSINIVNGFINNSAHLASDITISNSSTVNIALGAISNISNVSNATVLIEDATVDLGSGTISNVGDGAAALTIQNGRVRIGIGGITNTGNLGNATVNINQSEVVLDSGLFLCNSSQASSSVAIQNSSFTLGPLARLTTPGSVQISGAQNVTDIGITTNVVHGLISGQEVTLDGSLLVTFVLPEIVQGVEIPIIESTTPITTRFATHRFVDTPAYLAPHIFYSTNEVFVVTNHSSAVLNMNAFHVITAAERLHRLQKQLTRVHDRLSSQLDVFSVEETQEMASNDLFAQQMPIEQLAVRVQEKQARPWSVYAGPIGSLGQIHTTKGQLGNHFYSAGGLAGFDYAWMGDSSFPFGIGIGSSIAYSYNHSRVNEHAGKFQIETVYGNVYTVFVPKSYEKVSLNGAGGYGYEWLRTERSAGTASDPSTAKGKTHGYNFNALGGLEYLLVDNSDLSTKEGFRMILPIFYMHYAQSSLASHKEHGAGIFDLAVDRQKWSALWSQLGTRVNYLFRPTPNFQIRPELCFAWQYQFSKRDQPITFTSFATPFPQVFATSVIGPKPNSYIVGADLNFKWGETFFIQTDYDLVVNSMYLNNEFYLQFEWMF